MNEIWRAVGGFEGAYEVSNLGRVRSLDREYEGVSPTGQPSRCFMKGRILKQAKMVNGYMRAVLCVDGNRFQRSVHRLVAEAFTPAAQGREQVNHKDGDKANNRFDNLEWSNGSLNQLHALATGLVAVRRGSARAWAKLDEEKVREIKRRLASGANQRALAREFGVAPCKITMIKQGTAWKHVA